MVLTHISISLPLGEGAVNCTLPAYSAVNCLHARKKDTVLRALSGIALGALFFNQQSTEVKMVTYVHVLDQNPSSGTWISCEEMVYQVTEIATTYEPRVKAEMVC